MLKKIEEVAFLNCITVKSFFSVIPIICYKHEWIYLKLMSDVGGVKFNHFSLAFSFSLNSLVDPLCPKVLKIFQTMQFFHSD